MTTIPGLTGWQDSSGLIPVGQKIVFKAYDDNGTPPGLPVTDYVIKGSIEDPYPASAQNTYDDGIKVLVSSVDGFPPLPDSDAGVT